MFWVGVFGLLFLVYVWGIVWVALGGVLLQRIEFLFGVQVFVGKQDPLSDPVCVLPLCLGVLVVWSACLVFEA